VATANAVAAVTICRHELFGGSKPGALDAQADRASRDGLAWMADELDQFGSFGRLARQDGRRPGAGQLQFDRACALERACNLTRTTFLAKEDWHGEGAEWLMSIQAANGAWLPDKLGLGSPLGASSPVAEDSKDAVECTCLALLFLRQGPTLDATSPAPTRALGEFPAAAALSDEAFDEFVAALLRRWHGIGNASYRARLLAKTTAVGPRIVAPLVKRLSSSKAEDRVAASAMLKRATGLDHGYDPAAAPEARETAVAAWQAWWLANEKTLRYDAAIGRLIAAKSGG